LRPQDKVLRTIRFTRAHPKIAIAYFTPTRVLVLFVFGILAPASAQRTIVEIEKVQVVSAVSGIVRDPNGTPISGATVAEVAPDGKTVIQSTITDQEGSFTLVPKAKQKVYDLKIDKSPNFDPLIVHVRVSRWTKRVLDLKLEIST